MLIDLMVVCAVVALFLKPSDIAFKLLSSIIVIFGVVELVSDISNGDGFGTILDVLLIVVWTCNIFLNTDEPTLKISINVNKGTRQ